MGADSIGVDEAEKVRRIEDNKDSNCLRGIYVDYLCYFYIFI